MNIIVKPGPKAAPAVERTTINAEEMERRREAVRRAYAHNRIEGLFSSPEADEIFQSFVRGDIELQELGSRIDILHPRL